MENLQGRNSNGSNGTFLKTNSETETLGGGHCGKAPHADTGIGVDKDFLPAQDDCSCPKGVGGSNSSNSSNTNSSWLTCGQQHMHINNNNNSIELDVHSKCNVVKATAKTASGVGTAGIMLANVTTDVSCTGTEIKTSGNGDGGEDGKDGSNERITTGVARAFFSKIDSEVSCTNLKSNGCIDIEENGATGLVDAISASPQEAAGMVAGAVATPCDSHACTFDAFTAAAAAASAISRSVSVNNSTENLSFNSDNFYADDLLLLEGDDDIDDVDVDAEEISLNSDDCVYAYRGDGADFDLALDPLDGRRPGTGNTCMMDDETDFLEMDFEPDPLSEVEYGSVETAPGHSDAFLMQRDACHLSSGRHSATLGNYGPNGAAAAQRLLFCSPIDDSLPPPPSKTLQSQLMLSKNFARITMHLDQIKGENGDCDAHNRTHSDCASTLGMTENDAVDTGSSSIINTAHSLPNAIHSTNFGRDLLHTKVEDKSGTNLKVTGAKPKRFSTFSTSSSTSSKNSSKSRNSLRSTYALSTLCNSVSFDERSASCTEFRSAAPKLQTSTEDGMHSESSLVTNTLTTTTNDCDDLSANDDTCLDCLEKEFLANTIGKAIDSNECARCRKRSSSSMAIFKQRSAQTSIGATRCRSGSPLLFRDARDDCIFETKVGDYLQPRNVDWAASTFRDIGILKNDKWKDESVNCIDNERCGGDMKLAKPRVRTRVRARTCDANVLQQFKNDEKNVNQRRTTGDSCCDSEHLLKNLLLTEKETVTVSTLNLSEELLVQALDKLHVSYNLELIKSQLCYAPNSTTTTTTTTTNTSILVMPATNVKDFKDLKDLLMHESKKHCNHPKLKRLIEFATRQQVDVQFQQDSHDNTTILVPIRVTDILQLWARTKNLTVLKHLDKRFIEANVLGKVANMIRQAQQRCTQRRPLPECILIPQYYPVGVLRLTKKF